MSPQRGRTGTSPPPGPPAAPVGGSSTGARSAGRGDPQDEWRVRVSFTKLRTEPVTDVKGIHVFVTVDEGESYELGKIAIDDPCPMDKSTLLAEAQRALEDWVRVVTSGERS